MGSWLIKKTQLAELFLPPGEQAEASLGGVVVWQEKLPYDDDTMLDSVLDVVPSFCAFIQASTP